MPSQVKGTMSGRLGLNVQAHVIRKDTVCWESGQVGAIYGDLLSFMYGNFLGGPSKPGWCCFCNLTYRAPPWGADQNAMEAEVLPLPPLEKASWRHGGTGSNGGEPPQSIATGLSGEIPVQPVTNGYPP